MGGQTPKPEDAETAAEHQVQPPKLLEVLTTPIAVQNSTMSSVLITQAKAEDGEDRMEVDITTTGSDKSLEAKASE